MLTWLLLAVLGIIWAALLFPSRSRSPKSSVEEFEQKMNLLAEANRAAPGRWVLMPRKGQRFMGPDRGRARVRRRRRQVFMVLLEATGLTFIMGLFPPFRVMLGVTAFLAFVLLVYMAVLVRLRAEELERTRMQRFAAGDGSNGHGYTDDYGYAWPARPRSYEPASGSGYGNGNGKRRAAAVQYGNGNGYGKGHQRLDARVDWLESGLRLVDDDVHVVVYRSDEIDTSSLTPASAE
ncbi:MAG TPA: hypothetical protein VGL18_10790 [Actinomycetota bacterium]